MIETERLYMRKLKWSDIDDIGKILKDPLTMYAYEHGFSDEEVREWIEKQLKRYEDYGFGLWGVIEKRVECLLGNADLPSKNVTGIKCWR